MTLGSNAKPSTLIALSIVTFLAYFVRPAFLFLVVLWPTLGPWLTYFLYRQNLRVTGRTLVIYLLVVLLPLTAYAALRRSVMGEFGVVSFTGYNLIGVSGQFLTSEDVSNLPEECRSLAQGTIDRRVNIDNYSPPVRFETMVFLFNATVWKSAAPAAEALYGSDTSRSNRELLQLATELIRLHPDQYRNWLIANAQHAIDQWLKLMATDVGTRLVLLTGVAFMFFTLLARRFRWRCLICDTQDNGTLNRSVDGGVGFEVALLFWTMMVYSLGTIMLVILVEPANGRYVSAAMCLTPSFIGACLASLCIEIVCGHNSVPNCKSKPVN